MQLRHYSVRMPDPAWRAKILFAATLLLAAPARAQETETVTVIGQRGRSLDQPMAQAGATTTSLRARGITSLFDLGQAVPGLRVDLHGVSTQPNLRGIGVQNVLGPGVDSDVAIYVDGFYQAGQGIGIDLADVVRIDVLKGPQGSRFGRNAVGGAILLTTTDPGFQPQGHAAISYGSFHDRRLEGSFTTGLSDNLAISLSASGRESDNYFSDVVTGKPSAPIASIALRGKLLYRLGEGGRLVLAAAWSDIGDPSGIAFTVKNPLAAAQHDFFGVPQIHTVAPYKTSVSHPLKAGPKDKSLSLTGEFDLGWAQFTSRSLFHQRRYHMWSDQDGTSIPFWNGDFRMRLQSISQEFTLAGPESGENSRLQWQLGFHAGNDLSFLHHDSSQDPFATGTATSVFRSDLRVASESYGLFGEATYTLAPDWFLTAGARLSRESKSMRSSFLLTTPPTNGADAQSWDDFSPRLALRHALGPDANLYASFSQGFKSGNYNFISVGPQTPVKPQRVTQYELGYKQEEANWSLDAAFYYTSIRNLQTNTYVAACSCFKFTNAPRAESYGAELSGRYALDENISLHAAIAWTQARYREFIGEGATGQPFIPPVYGYATAPADFAGNPMLYSPDWTSSIGLDWRLPSSIGQWQAAANLALTSRVSFAPDRNVSQAGYGLLNLSVGWTAPQADWSVTALARNVTGTRYQTFSSLSFLGQTMTYGAPAEWSLRLARNF